MNLNYSEKQINGKTASINKTAVNERPRERVSVPAHVVAKSMNVATNERFFTNKLAKHILRSRTKVFDVSRTSDNITTDSVEVSKDNHAKKSKARSSISGIAINEVESVDITNLLTLYTREYVAMHSHLPFVLQSINMDELAAYSLEKNQGTSYQNVIVNRFYIIKDGKRTYMDSQFGMIDEHSTFTFVNDLTLSAGDSGLTEPKLVGAHVSWENGILTDQTQVKVYRTLEDNVNYWKKFCNAVNNVDPQKASGSVVFDVLLLLLFAHPSFRNVTPNSLIVNSSDGNINEKLSENVAQLLAYIMTDCFATCMPRDANGDVSNTDITITVDDAVTLILAYFATQSSSGMALANLVTVNGAATEEVIIKEDPIIELSSLTMIMPENIVKLKPKYRKYKNAVIKIKTKLPVIEFAGSRCVTIATENKNKCACYAKVDENDFITAYIEDILDFSDLSDAKIWVGRNKKDIQKDFAYKKNPVQLVIDGFIAVSQAVLPDATSLPQVKISHKVMSVTSYDIKTKAPLYMSDEFYFDSSFMQSTEITSGIFVHGLGSRMPIIENRQSTGWCSSLTDIDGDGITFQPVGVQVSEYAAGETFLLGGEERVRRRQCVQYLGNIADGLALADIDQAFLEVGLGSLNATNAKVIAVDSSQVMSAKYEGVEYKWPRLDPYSIAGISAADAMDQAKLLNWLHTLVNNVGQIKDKVFFIVMYSKLRSDDQRFRSLPGVISDYSFDHTITDSSNNNTGLSYGVNGQGELFSSWMDPSTGAYVWRKIEVLDQNAYYYFEGGDKNVYYTFEQGFANLVEATPDTSNVISIRTHVSYTVANTFYLPELLLLSCDNVFVRSERCMIGDVNFPTVVVAGNFNDKDANFDDFSYATTIRCNAMSSVLSEAALRSFTTKRVPRVKLAQILLSLQDQYADPITNQGLGSFKAGKFGMVVDSYLLRELVKTSKEKRSIRTFNMFKALFDALTVEPNEESVDVPLKKRSRKKAITGHAIDQLLIEVDPDFGVDVPEFAEYIVTTEGGAAAIPFTKLFEGITTDNLVLPVDVKSKLDEGALAKYSKSTLVDIIKDYINCSDYADTSERLNEVRADMEVQLAYITNAKEQLMNEYANLSADTVIMNLENAMDAVEDVLTDATEDTEVIVDQTVTDIKNSVLTQFNAGASEISSSMNDYYASFVGECDQLQNRIAEKVKSEAEKVSINAKKFYNAKLHDIKNQTESNNLSFSLDNLFTTILQHNNGILSLLGEATGLIAGSNTYLGWQDSCLFTPTSTLTAVSGAAKSGLEAAVSTAYHLVSRAVTAIGDNVKRIVTETWKDGVSYHIRNSGFNTLGLQAATLIVDRTEFEDQYSNWYWLGKHVLSKLDGTNSYYIAAQIGPCLIFIQDYSSDQIIITLNPVILSKDEVMSRNDYYMAEAEADSVRYTLTFLNEIQKLLIKPEIGLIDYAIQFRVPSKSTLMSDILANAKGKSAAATWGLRGLILGLGVAAGALLLLSGFGSAAGGAMILGATAVGLSCTGEAVDQSKVERLKSDSVYANGVIMSSDLASIWTSVIPTSAVRLCLDILAAFSNVEYEYNGHICIGSLCHAGDGLIIDLPEALGRPTELDGEAFSFLGYIPMITYAGTPTFKYTLVTDRERFAKQSAMMLGSVVSIGSLAAIAVKNGFKHHKSKQLAKAQAQQYAGVKPKPENFRKPCKNADGSDVLDENGNPITVIDKDAYESACKTWNSTYSYQLRLQKKVNRWTRTVSSSAGGSAGDSCKSLMNIFNSYSSPEENEPIQYVIKRMG